MKESDAILIYRGIDTGPDGRPNTRWTDSLKYALHFTNRKAVKPTGPTLLVAAVERVEFDQHAFEKWGPARILYFSQEPRLLQVLNGDEVAQLDQRIAETVSATDPKVVMREANQIGEELLAIIWVE